MGVNGFELLKRAVDRGFPTVILTAHALTPQTLKKSIKLGAVSFLPKDKMPEIQLFLEDVVLGGEKPVWKKLFDKLGDYFNKRFGPDWQDRIGSSRNLRLNSSNALRISRSREDASLPVRRVFKIGRVRKPSNLHYSRIFRIRE